jgi:hypothetical protein
MSADPVGYDALIGLWQDGTRRAQQAEGPERAAIGAVVDALVDELHRRLGGPFTVQELADLYLAGIDWCFDLAVRIAPGRPAAWDLPIVAGAAFARYAREAIDYTTGRGQRPE